MAGTDGLDPSHPFEDGLGSRSVVVLGTGDGARRENAAVETAAQHDRHVAFLAEGEELVEGLLFEQRVPPCEQEAVEIVLFQRLVADLPLIHADADGLDDAFAAQLVQRPPAPVHCMAEDFGLAVAHGEAVDVVDERDVDALQPQALQAVLEGPHGPVVGVVEMHAEGEPVHPG